MSAPNYKSSDFLSALQALMPRGLAWPRDVESIMAQVLGGLAPTWARHTQRNNNLLVDAFPATALELLPEWESALGLPDPCAGSSPTLQQRRNQVVARLTNNGGQSANYFIAYAAALGYAITVISYAPARCGISRCGDPVNQKDWAHAWSIEAPIDTVVYARAGQSAIGEPLEAWGNNVLECEMRTIGPAHAVLQFNYQTPLYSDSVVTGSGRPVITSLSQPVIQGNS